MSSANISKSGSEPTVICIICKRVVEDEQLEIGRAVCGICDEGVFGAVPKPRPMTMKEIERVTNMEEEKQFLRMMKNMYRRVRPSG